MRWTGCGEKSNNSSKTGLMLEALLEEVRACRLCEAHLPQGPRPVVRAGEKARILIAGQAPGRAVHASGVPFDDPSGDRLRLWMGLEKAQFYDPSQVALLPMGFCYPGTGKGGDLPPRPECAVTWRQRLLDHLPKIELTLVIGRYAIDWHLPQCARQPVTRVVAGWQDFWPGCLPMPHPSPRNNRWLKTNPWFEADIVPRLQKRVAQLVR